MIVHSGNIALFADALRASLKRFREGCGYGMTVLEEKELILAAGGKIDDNLNLRPFHPGRKVEY